MLIKELHLSGILSFGLDTPPLSMRPLNVLIGPNGSGKSNLIETIGLLRSAPSKLAVPMRGTGGGVAEWIWKGDPQGQARIEVVVSNDRGDQPLRHCIEFTQVASRFELLDEWIENNQPFPGYEEPYFYYRYQKGHPMLAVYGDETRRQLQRQDVALDESILSQRRDPDLYPELTYLADYYSAIRLYREWSFGRSSVFRSPQSADLPGDRLEEDFSNLGLFLNHLRGIPAAKKLMLEHLHYLYEGLDDFDVRIKGGTVEVFLTEGDFVIPASRLSDGTLRYLCLLAILCDPDPPPVICIEEPELGLHPDMLPKLADLMCEAADRTQLIITTHSDILVDAMSEDPESVVVVEKHDGKTTMNRLQEDTLKIWLEKYRLGQLWTRGEIGGTRW